MNVKNDKIISFEHRNKYIIVSEATLEHLVPSIFS